MPNIQKKTNQELRDEILGLIEAMEVFAAAAVNGDVPILKDNFSHFHHIPEMAREKVNTLYNQSSTS